MIGHWKHTYLAERIPSYSSSCALNPSLGWTTGLWLFTYSMAFSKLHWYSFMAKAITWSKHGEQLTKWGQNVREESKHNADTTLKASECHLTRNIALGWTIIPFIRDIWTGDIHISEYYSVPFGKHQNPRQHKESSILLCSANLWWACVMHKTFWDSTGKGADGSWMIACRCRHWSRNIQGSKKLHFCLLKFNDNVKPTLLKTVAPRLQIQTFYGKMQTTRQQLVVQSHRNLDRWQQSIYSMHHLQL